MIARVRAAFTAGSIRGDATRIYILQFATIAFSFVTSILVARTLGPSQKGVVDLFNLLNAFINDLGSLGFGTGLLYFLMARGRPADSVHGAATGFSLLSGLATAVLGIVALTALRRAFPGLPVWAIVLACCLAPATYYRLIWGNLMTGLNSPVIVYWLGLGTGVVSATALTIAWLSHVLTPRFVIVLVATVTAAGALVAFAALKRRVGVSRPPKTLVRESAAYGFITYASAAANTLHFKIDQVMLNSMLGTSAVGVYAVGVRWAETVFLLDGAIFAAALHRIGSRSDIESYALTRRLFFIQLMISAGAAGVIALLSPWLVTGMYGEAYSGARLPMLILMPGVVAWSAGKLLSQYIVLRRGKSAIALWFSLIGLAVNAAINFVLIPRAGLVGAAIASSTSYGLVILLTLVAFRYLGRTAENLQTSAAAPLEDAAAS